MRRCRALHRLARMRLAIIAWLILPVACISAGTGAADEAQRVRIALTRDSTVAPLLVAVGAGAFKAEGLDPQLVYLASDRAVTAAVVDGKADIGLAGVSAAFYRSAAGHRLKIIASRSSDQTGFPRYALLISAKARAAGFTKVHALPHQRIGMAAPDAGPSYALFAIATRFGLDIGAIRTIALGSTTSTLGVLSRGEIDAALLPYPVALRSIRRDQSLLLLSDFVRWQDGVVFASSATIAARRDLIARFMRAYQRGTADYELNFLSYDDAGDFIPGPRYDEYLHALARQLQVAPDFLSMTKAYCDRRANLDLADIEKQLRFWQGQGRLDPRIAMSDLVDPSFIGEETVAPQTSRP